MEVGNVISLSVALFLIFLFWIGGIYMFIESRSSKIEVQRQLHIGLAQMLVIWGFGFLPTLISSVIWEGRLFTLFNTPSIFPEVGDLSGDAPLAAAFLIFSISFSMNNIEKYIKNSKKYILTKILRAISIICLVVFILGFYEAEIPELKEEPFWYYFIYIILFLAIFTILIAFFSLPIIYFNLAKKTSGGLRKNSLIIAVGYLFLIVALIFQALKSLVLDTLPMEIQELPGPIGGILALIILIYGYVKMTTPVLDYYTSTDICILCRNKIVRNLHLCPNCLVKFCEKCFNMVIKNENQCWSCKAILDSKKDDTIALILDEERGQLEFEDDARLKKKGA